MNLKIYQIDAFAKTVFEGNPAAVVPLDAWLDDALMQKIAMENNLSETAYFVKEGAHYRIRWFTPVAEVDMCGHATLSSAFVLFEELGFSGDEVVFESKSAKYDFVCRFFAPKLGIDEDPVTGAAFTQLVPYWSEVLGKKSFHAKQVSTRGGEVWCASLGERVQIAGYGVKYLEGVIQL